ncbi:MAG: hypothetical protein A3A98_01850 [Candidatus Staskawiczbacteria bacterium RIFCSPLOWO2_01_FULL_40_39]|uniref:RNA polymerase sigma factor n=1 Tax=Candidatus Staskawiczbacteria bacterium RIFCSPHIGHO2_01_FULL_39_25 TaxID=1802202 RepID=A0A1G2HQA3_9BACT|nr:MAG: hypothetical protein A2730_02005 [Candidatus Staskawiczbacteria bacterium RIFCSPHIGHO2_01_FULL_39_25]OGZ72714.1 MAG: hypothetical protein A3A98_01850 [Candidatus Staskawiczbacteria bacterium RIFCSPLOWO2_01_FULL_40_39]OGZ76602.1 MAG: hypothetical protein A3I87_03000 [Candidatus Staskawiczbacteria bacterium RIFCSPLOWO2_02_FULL_39_8]
MGERYFDAMNTSNQEQQFIEAYDKYSEAIFRHCYYRIFDREAAKDFMQETFCRTWKYISRGNKIDNIRAFLYRTANNIIIDESRKRKNVSLNEIMEKGFYPNIDTRKSTENSFTAQEILAVVNSIDKKYRDVIVLKYVNDLSPREIAKAIHEKENNVYIRIHRGLQKIKGIFLENEAKSHAIKLN